MAKKTSLKTRKATNMDAQTINAIENLVNRAREPHAFAQDPNAVYVYSLDGLKRIPVPTTNLSYQVFDLESLALMASRVKPDAVDSTLVLVNPLGIVLETWENGERSVVGMQLQHSNTFAKLQQLEKPQKLSQQQLIDLLRIEFGGRHDDIIAKLKALRYNSSARGSSELDNHGSSLGRDIEQRVSSRGGDLPDEFVVHGPVWANFAPTINIDGLDRPFEAEVRLYLSSTVEGNSVSFALQASADDIQASLLAALAAAVAEAEDALAEHDLEITVVQGRSLVK
jgi:hypothetical protein